MTGNLEMNEATPAEIQAHQIKRGPLDAFYRKSRSAQRYDD
jgi:hypothetical protein